MKLLIITTLFMLLGNAPSAKEPGSYCVIPNVEAAYKSATTVFVGQVIDIESPQTRDQKAPAAERLYSIHFKVERSWKGAAFGDVTVLSGQGEGVFAFPAVKTGQRLLYMPSR